MIVQVEGVEEIKEKRVDRFGRLVGFADWKGALVKVLKISSSESEEGAKPIIMEKEENLRR